MTKLYRWKTDQLLSGVKDDGENGHRGENCGDGIMLYLNWVGGYMKLTSDKMTQNQVYILFQCQFPRFDPV